ncbi:hypothetical protein LXL04_021676 [Taraxacum kok-saghyz]
MQGCRGREAAPGREAAIGGRCKVEGPCCRGREAAMASAGKVLNSSWSLKGDKIGIDFIHRSGSIRFSKSLSAYITVSMKDFVSKAIADLSQPHSNDYRGDNWVGFGLRVCGSEYSNPTQPIYLYGFTGWRVTGWQVENINQTQPTNPFNYIGSRVHGSIWVGGSISGSWVSFRRCRDGVSDGEAMA